MVLIAGRSAGLLLGGAIGVDRQYFGGQLTSITPGAPVERLQVIPGLDAFGLVGRELEQGACD